MGLAVLPPDINASGLKFTPDPSGPGIRFGLGSIKNVGSGAMESAIAERDKNGAFASLGDFCSRLDSRTVNRKVLESLVKCGAFDGIDTNRAALFAEIEGAMAAAASVQRDRASGQVSLFDEAPAPAKSPRAAKVEPWAPLDVLRDEKELLGYYVSGHPLDSYAGHFDSGKYNTVAQARAATEPGSFKLAGIVTAVEKRFSKKDSKPFGVFTLEDFTGSLEITAWDEAWAKNAALVAPGNAVAATVRVSRRDELIRATVSSISGLKPKASLNPVRLRIDRGKVDAAALEVLLKAVKENPGKRPLFLEFPVAGGGFVEIQSGDEFRVSDERPLLAALGL
jgi:DNA polymerase-3 subunit alpha